MEQVLPIVIFCCVGIVLCLSYLVLLIVKSVNSSKSRKRESFDFDENTLTISLKKRKK